MSNKIKKHDNRSKRNLLIAIGAVSALLVILIALTLVFSLKKEQSGDQSSDQSAQTTVPADLSEPTQPDNQADPQIPDDPEPPVINVPTESAPLVLEQDLYIVHMGNFSGRFVEDGSDAQLENFCAVIVENRTEKTVQLLQFKITSADQVHEFQLTTLPPGERAIVQDLNRASFVPGEAILTAEMEVCLFFEEEPSLHEDVFAISGSENGLELRNRTDADIPGPIYVYYKTRTAEGYGGGITYRVAIPGLEANGTYNAAVSHFWPGSSQVMFIDYAQ